eukprot:TRINITY_DN5933_c0_g1_i1.p1 TRINITY_DN5933_c0_g1~~TRINITY_DN5933_c0_g1_i1.p1  ORF type:complete len:337 (-),score=57.15 TRINITY_DN5933_c0_g1_i1:62-985(-)
MCIRDRVSTQSTWDPHLKIFDVGGKCHADLQNILELFHFYRADMGYVQGMAYIGAILMFYLDAYKTFKCMVNLLIVNDFVHALYSFNMRKIEVYFKCFDHFLRDKSPNVFKHFQERDVTPDMYLVEWFYTLFSRSFTFENTLKLWDLFLFHGEVVIFRTGLHLLKMIEPKLVKLDYDGTLFLLRSCTREIDQEELLDRVAKSSLSHDKLQQRFLREEKKLEKAGKFVAPPQVPVTVPVWKADTKSTATTTTHDGTTVDEKMQIFPCCTDGQMLSNHNVFSVHMQTKNSIKSQFSVSISHTHLSLIHI